MQLTLILVKIHEQPIQACCLFSFSGISVYGVFLSAFRCMEKNISFFLTGDLQITFLRNKSNWPKMTGNYWAIKLCARPLMHRGGIWFIKKKKRSRVKKIGSHDRTGQNDPDRCWPYSPNSCCCKVYIVF